MKKVMDVTSEDLAQLREYGHHVINKHFSSIDRTFDKIVENRGHVFTDYIALNKLTKAEALLISSYADCVASPINRELRRHEPEKNKAVLEYERLLNIALDKITPHANSKVYVKYNCPSEEAEQLDWFSQRVGKVVQFPNFLGSSRYRWTDESVFLEIYTATNSVARYIAPLTNKVESEQEVLFISNSKFLIERVDKEEETIFLTEHINTVSANYVLTDCYRLNYED